MEETLVANIVEGEPDDCSIMNQIMYLEMDDEKEEDHCLRVGKRMYLIQRTAEEEKRINERKTWDRFGTVKGTNGMERGVTTPSYDTVEILDPYSDEAKKTGEDKLIERIQQRIQESNKSKSQNSQAK